MIELKSISEILDKEFLIPSYQRGYRWDTQQVEDLLEDILEFINKDKAKKEFYCLQPIVVKKNKDNYYRILDGQQRLTSIYIILKYFEDLLEEDYYIENIYNLSYETRENSASFLKNIKSVKELDKTNIDFFYMSQSYLIVKEWFKTNIQNKRITKRKFLEVLIDSDIKEEMIEEQKIQIDCANNIRVIWYEIQDEDEKEIDVFTRLNSGKIPLTPSELIKALLLLDRKEDNEKLLLASQWDEIEYKLQDENFFAFINKDIYEKDTRIEFIFDLIANNLKDKVNIEYLREDDRLRSFYIFYELIKTFKQDLWDQVKTYFRIFEELYNDNTYYHLVGFLVNSGGKIEGIIKEFQVNKKDVFLDILRSQINGIVFVKHKRIEDLNYEDNHKLISNILFLFNVLETLKTDVSRYPFDKHKLEKWSLEHIHAQNSQDMEEVDKKILLENQEKYINDEELKKKIKELQYQDKIDEALRQIASFLGDNGSLHTIDNLALLSRDDNSSLNNRVFPAKRDKIKELDKHGSFIPLGTKNVFLKYYSDDLKEVVRWSKEDRDAYVEILKETLGSYIGEEK